MPNPAEIAVVTSGGQDYNIWTQIEASALFAEVMDHVILTVAEISTPTAQALSTLKLGPGNTASVSLGGTQIMSGVVYMRQATLNADMHAVQIGITSNSHSVMKVTVPAKPGQHINQSVSSIISYLYGTVGVGFNCTAPGGSTVIPRFSEHVGETLFDAAERLCKMVNIHQIDDGMGNIIGFTGPSGGGSMQLTEGFNILSGRLLLRNDETVGPIETVGQQPTTDSTQNHNPKGTASTGTTNRPVKFMAEMAGNSALMTTRAQNEASFVKYHETDGLITVQGWFAPDGSLWWQHGHNRELITLTSPLLLPDRNGNSSPFMIKGVVHRQNSESGTTTDILLCDPQGFGVGGSGNIETTS